MARSPYIYHIEKGERTIASFTVKHEMQSHWVSLMPEEQRWLKVIRVRDGSYGKHDYRVDITEEVHAGAEV